MLIIYTIIIDSSVGIFRVKTLCDACHKERIENIMRLKKNSHDREGFINISGGVKN